MNVEQNELMLIYNSKDLQDKEALAYAKSLKHFVVKEFDVQKDQMTALQFEELLNRLKIDVIDLVDDKSVIYEKEYKSVDLDRNGVMKALTNHPELMKTPIAIYHDRGEFIGTSYEFVKKDMVNTGMAATSRLQDQDPQS